MKYYHISATFQNDDNDLSVFSSGFARKGFITRKEALNIAEDVLIKDGHSARNITVISCYTMTKKEFNTYF